MKKKSKTMRAASFLLVLTLMTSCFVGSTFAKYTSTTTVSDTARVAKWSFEVNDKDIAKSEVFTFDLFSTVNDFGGTSDDADVLNGVNENIIAPGTQGSFQIVLENTSEVTAKYSIAYTVTNESKIPIEYCVDGTNWKNSLEDVMSSSDTTLNYGSGKTSATVKVEWRWAFEGSSSENFKSTQTDITDTNLGVLAQYNSAHPITIEAKIIAEQVD